jgi:peptidoglycan/LPS O-acetylase OafA/YrhL
MGLAVASAALHGRERRPWPVRLVERRPWLPWALALGILAMLTFGVGATALFPQRTWYGVFSLLVLLPCIFGQEAGGWPRRLLATRPMAYLGAVTYGTFLYHRPVVTWLWDHGVGRGGHPWLGYAALLTTTLAITVGLATASYYLLERPFLRLKAQPRSERRPALRPAYARGSAPR